MYVAFRSLGYKELSVYDFCFLSSLAPYFSTHFQELNSSETSPSASFAEALQEVQEWVESNPQGTYL